MFSTDRAKTIPLRSEEKKIKLRYEVQYFLSFKNSSGTETLNLWKRPEPGCSFDCG